MGIRSRRGTDSERRIPHGGSLVGWMEKEFNPFLKLSGIHCDSVTKLSTIIAAWLDQDLSCFSFCRHYHENRSRSTQALLMRLNNMTESR